MPGAVIWMTPLPSGSGMTAPAAISTRQEWSMTVLSCVTVTVGGSSRTPPAEMVARRAPRSMPDPTRSERGADGQVVRASLLDLVGAADSDFLRERLLGRPLGLHGCVLRRQGARRADGGLVGLFLDLV